jgi:hypothetical protein
MSKTLIIGLGTGRCGSLSLSYFLNNQPGVKVMVVIVKLMPGQLKPEILGLTLLVGKYLAFTDDDCTLPQKWLQYLKKSFLETPNVL